MSALLLRLAGPLAAFGTSAAFHDRDTAPHPTRSALIGMFANCAGRAPQHALDSFTELPGQPCYQDLGFLIRIDRPGTLHTDFHTVGGGHPRDKQLRTSGGPQRPQTESTLVSHRRYLADPVFTVAVTGPTPLLQTIAGHLRHPHNAPYLGRRNCVPTEPLVLATAVTDPMNELTRRIPLSLARPPRPHTTTVNVDFVHEDPPPDPSTAIDHYELCDQPVDFTPGRRRYHPRTVWRTRIPLPAALYAGPDPFTTLADYMHPEQP